MSYLVIEDDRLFAELVGAAINAKEIRFATTMQEAIRMIDRQPPNYIVLDLSLPDSMPEQTMRLIRDLKTKSHGATIIVISGYDSPENQRSAIASGADVFLPKSGGDKFMKELLDKLNATQRAEEPCANRNIVEAIEDKIVDLVGRPISIPRLTRRAVQNLLPLLH